MAEQINDERFTAILQEAASIGKRFGARTYDTYHMLLAIIRRDHILRTWLADAGVHINQLLDPSVMIEGDDPSISVLLERVRNMAATAELPRQPVHLLYTILSFGEGSRARRTLGEICNADALQREIVTKGWHQEILYSEETNATQANDPFGGFAENYTDKAERGAFRMVVGREDELKDVIHILARRDTEDPMDEAINNPLLLGHAGVGKSALAKSLAVMITREDKRVRLFWGYRVVYVKLGTLQAGTGMRGSFETRVGNILAECANAPTILFLDELHVAMGLGRTDGNQGLDEMLKPALAGGLNCIGATTIEEGRKYIEGNTAFARRWIPVNISEPDSEQTMAIVTGSADDLARRHLVHFSPEVLGETVHLARKFIADLYSPAREIETVLNGVGAMVKLDNRVYAERTDVASVIERVTGTPILLGEDEEERLRRAPAILANRVHGQPVPTSGCGNAVIRHRSGMADPNKPLVVLELGPTGVGKTLLARTVAEEFMYNRFIRLDMSEYMERHTVSRLIGSPPGYVGYGEEGQLTGPLRRFRGMAVLLLDEIEKAHSDVFNILLQLFDYGVVTDSHGRQAHGAQSVIIMTSNLAANLFFRQGADGPTIGFGRTDNEVGSLEDVSQRVIAEARRSFSAEFWNRIDEIIVFHPLERPEVRTIAEGLLNEERVKCHRTHFGLEWAESVVDYLIQHGCNRQYGARPMKRMVMRTVQTLLARARVFGQIPDHCTVHLYRDTDVDQIRFRIVN